MTRSHIMLEMVWVLVGTTVLAVLKPTTAQIRRFERRARPHLSGRR